MLELQYLLYDSLIYCRAHFSTRYDLERREGSELQLRAGRVYRVRTNWLDVML